MNSNPLSKTAAAETAPIVEPEVFVRDHNGGAKRVPLSVADGLVANGLAERMSRAGHVRLKLGIGIERIDAHRGASANVTTIGRQDTKRPHPRCADWRKRA